MRRKFFEIQTVISGKTRFFRTVYGATIWIVKLNFLSVPAGAHNVLKTLQGVNDVFGFTFCGRPIKEVETAFQAACVRAGVGAHVGENYQVFT